ncbi:MAG: cytidylate kinase-like family protein [Duncaniella sp.]|nr:cytidylate kinase-like family protein [Duncaniella sp.]MDE6860267.1 cytidylate kinase-like family protein [Duncaniella sp.]
MSKEPFVITVGRQFGSGGRELGKALAEALEIEYYDKELLVESAKLAGVNPEYFEKKDERFPTFLQGLFSFSMGVTPMCYYTGTSSIADDGLYKSISDFLLKTSREKSFVVVGRSADYILREHPRCVNIFIHAPIEDCVRRITRRNDAIDEAKAAAMARKTNKWRADYYNFFTDKTWGDAKSYDLTIDSSLMSMENNVLLIKEYLRLRGIID